MRWHKLSQASGNPGYRDYAGHFATGFKWWSSVLIYSSSILWWPFWGVWRGCPTTWNVWHWSFMVPGVMLDILQHLCSWSSSILGVPLSTPITTSTRYDIVDHQFLVQEAIPHDVMPLEIDYLSSYLGPSGFPIHNVAAQRFGRCLKYFSSKMWKKSSPVHDQISKHKIERLIKLHCHSDVLCCLHLNLFVILEYVKLKIEG